jgi:hypothetical protein
VVDDLARRLGGGGGVALGRAGAGGVALGRAGAGALGRAGAGVKSVVAPGLRVGGTGVSVAAARVGPASGASEGRAGFGGGLLRAAGPGEKGRTCGGAVVSGTREPGRVLGAPDTRGPAGREVGSSKTGCMRPGEWGDNPAFMILFPFIAAAGAARAHRCASARPKTPPAQSARQSQRKRPIFS